MEIMLRNFQRRIDIPLNVASHFTIRHYSYHIFSSMGDIKMEMVRQRLPIFGIFQAAFGKSVPIQDLPDHNSCSQTPFAVIRLKIPDDLLSSLWSNLFQKAFILQGILKSIDIDSI